MFVHLPTCSYAPRGVHPICPHTPLCICMFSEAFACCGGICKGLPYVLRHFPYTTSVWGCLPFSCTPLHLVIGLPVHQYVLGISVCHVGIFPSVGGLGDVPPSVWGSGGTSALVMFICSFLYIFVVHYVSHFYYGYDYYYSGYDGIFWPIISLISDSGSFPHRASSKLGSAWSGSTTTLDTKRLWRCYWLSFCATAANSIFDASSGLWQLCYGFSTGRFLFQS